MEVFLVIVVVVAGLWFVVRLFSSNKRAEAAHRYSKKIGVGNTKFANKITKQKSKRSPAKEKRKSDFSQAPLASNTDWLPLDGQAIKWCADFLAVEEKQLREILLNISKQYNQFKIGKRSGGFRTISAPGKELLSIQKTIYQRALIPVNLHPAATGFRHKISILDNAKPHLGKADMLKTDIVDFFGSIKYNTVVYAFEKIGYPTNISEVLAELCCLRLSLPQGAPTSPALSNIVAYEMDQKLTNLAAKHSLSYTRYADDLTFSGESINSDRLASAISKSISEFGFYLKQKKTRFLSKGKRKIVTGISISSGEKLTIPRCKKREIKQAVYYILTKGLAEHQKYISSTDPVYLKRIIGYLHFWHSVEPDNRYVAASIEALKKLSK